ncbi:hypothetical protein [Vibrio vulnificus YJ016]|uniref:Uncharacterized protein n=1 Tax=Vibrio vulnificus (strain YJ016) TaxID=196600 RepID=Q7MMW5_VIBVY|nr:hypothetical protein [Vibrio vulnificus YJ016]
MPKLQPVAFAHTMNSAEIHRDGIAKNSHNFWQGDLARHFRFHI